MRSKAIALSLLAWLLLAFISISWAAPPVTATLHIIVAVKAKVKLQVLKQTNQIEVTAGDISRSYLDVPDAAELLVSTNLQSGLSIIAQVWGDLQGSGKSISISNLYYSLDGGNFSPLSVGEQVIYRGQKQEAHVLKRIGYRLLLNQGMQPGVYSLGINFVVMGN